MNPVPHIMEPAGIFGPPPNLPAYSAQASNPSDLPPALSTAAAEWAHNRIPSLAGVQLTNYNRPNFSVWSIDGHTDNKIGFSVCIDEETLRTDQDMDPRFGIEKGPVTIVALIRMDSGGPRFPLGTWVVPYTQPLGYPHWSQEFLFLRQFGRSCYVSAKVGADHIIGEAAARAGTVMHASFLVLIPDGNGDHFLVDYPETQITL